MYFCPNCYYILDITKSSDISKVDDRIIINKINDILKLLDDNDIIFSNYKADIPIEELFKNKKYQKLKDIDKDKIKELFKDDISSGAEFKCDICNYSNQINETTLLYQINIDNEHHIINTIEENELITKNPLLPHTHDYICKNMSCITHKNNDIKDSVFYKNKNNYKVNYICCVCYYNW